MNVQFMATVTGPDRASVLNQLAECTHNLGGRWLKSKSNRLGGQFSALIRVELAAENEGKIKEAFQSIADYSVEFHACVDDHPDVGEVYSLVVGVSDRSGLIHDITRLLAAQGAIIDHMECHRLGVAPLGVSVFTASMNVTLDREVDPETLIAELETLGADVKVDLHKKSLLRTA